MTTDFPGGRAAALAALARIRPARYGRTRNFLDGAVTRLSPYLRHGVLTLAEARDATLALELPRREIEKFVQELAWRDYYVRVYRLLGDVVWDDLESYKTGLHASDYADELPEDIARAATGLACMDGFVSELFDTGYLHNHARMWFASYVVHFRRVRWQAGARLFLAHLLDGDPASNNLSWQWIASTFARGTYIFNRANLERYTRGAYCARCPLATGGCPFEASYDRLEARLFPEGHARLDEVPERTLAAPPDETKPTDPLPAAVVWQHEEALSEANGARMLAPDAPAIFVWDVEARQRDPWSDARVRFAAESLSEMRLDAIERGDAAEHVVAFARARGADAVVAIAPVDPRLRAVAAAVAREVPVRLVEPAAFTTLATGADLRRFSRYWQRARTSAFRQTPP